MKTKKINIVVGFTPFHSLYVGSFLGDLDGMTYCFFTKGYPEVDGRSDVKRLGVGRNKILSFFFYSLFLKFLILRGHEIHLYCPHPCHLATNYLFFSSRCTSITIYEDGIANYYDANRSKWMLPLYKRILGCIVFLPFRSYAGHITGCDEKFIDRCFVSRPKLIVKSHRFGRVLQCILSICSGERPRIINKILFLDQPVDLHNNEKVRLLQSICNSMVDEVEVYYKPHHDSSSDFKFMKTLPEGHKKMPAEELISLEDYSVVLSFYSSALINIQSLFSDIKCYYIVAECRNIEVDGSSIGIYELLESNGVQSIYKSGILDVS